MSFQFNAEEIFEMAMQIERNGARFYRKAAEGAIDSHARQMLLDLALMEDEHEKVFAGLKTELSGQEKEQMVSDPNNEMVLFLKAMADANIFNPDEDPSKQLTGKETIQNVIRVAIKLENNSISFYTGMKNMVPKMLGKDKIDAIMKEEMGHVVMLNDKLKAQ